MSTALIAGALLDAGGGPLGCGSQRSECSAAVRVIGTSSTSLTMAWEAGHGRPVLEFALFRDGQGVATTVDTSYTFTGLSCGSTYTLGVEGLDSAGNRSERASVHAAPDACPAPETPRRRCRRGRFQVPPSLAQPPVEPSPPTALPASPTEPQTGASHPGTRSGEMSWRGAGAFVWHETDVAPETLGLQLRANGFSWVAVMIMTASRRTRSRKTGCGASAWRVACPSEGGSVAHGTRAGGRHGAPVARRPRATSTSRMPRRSTSSATTTVRA